MSHTLIAWLFTRVCLHQSSHPGCELAHFHQHHASLSPDPCCLPLCVIVIVQEDSPTFRRKLQAMDENVEGMRNHLSSLVAIIQVHPLPSLLAPLCLHPKPRYDVHPLMPLVCGCAEVYRGGQCLHVGGPAIRLGTHAPRGGELVRPPHTAYRCSSPAMQSPHIHTHFTFTDKGPCLCVV